MQFEVGIFYFFFEKMEKGNNLMNEMPDDIRKFLIFKEQWGRTQLHIDTCSFRGIPELKGCCCKKTLAAKSVDTILGKIRAILRDIGRSEEWNPVLLTGNPASSPVLKKHIQAITLEQSRSEISRKEAAPMIFDKLGRLCRYLSYNISVEENPNSKLYWRETEHISLSFVTRVAEVVIWDFC